MMKKFTLLFSILLSGYFINAQSSSSNLVAEQCGDTFNLASDTLFCDTFANISLYRFRLIDTITNLAYIVPNSSPYITLNSLPSGVSNGVYKVDVSMIDMGGNLIAYGSSCYIMINIITTSIKDKNEISTDIKVFPNPSSNGEVSLIFAESFGAQQYQIVNLLGKTLKSGIAREESNIIELPETPGYYILRVGKKGNQKNFKILRE